MGDAAFLDTGLKSVTEVRPAGMRESRANVDRHQQVLREMFSRHPSTLTLLKRTRVPF
jgi:hypothetical protein